MLPRACLLARNSCLALRYAWQSACNCSAGAFSVSCVVSISGVFTDAQISGIAGVPPLRKPRQLKIAQRLVFLGSAISCFSHSPRLVSSRSIAARSAKEGLPCPIATAERDRQQGSLLHGRHMYLALESCARLVMALLLLVMRSRSLPIRALAHFPRRRRYA